MSVKCQDICEAIEKWAPKYLAEDWDNVGLQVGDLRQSVARLLVALDVTPEVIRQAKELGVNMVVSHHPLLFRPLKNVCVGSTIGTIVTDVIKHDIAVYSAHTNLDSAKAGVNDLLAEKIGLGDLEILDTGYREKLVKLTVFVPVGYETALRIAMTEAGAGWIGNYSHCTFLSKGMGTFFPQEGTNPFVGTQGELEQVEEYRLETIVREKQVHKIIAAMLKVHPYEEVAYDIYPLLNTGTCFGLGRIGQLAEPLTVEALAHKLKADLRCSAIRVAGNLAQEVQQVALCGGSGASLIDKAKSAGADVYITGDLKYHEVQEAIAAGLTIIDAGHFATEQLIVPAIARYLKAYAQEQGWNLEIYTAEEREPFNFV